MDKVTIQFVRDEEHGWVWLQPVSGDREPLSFVGIDIAAGAAAQALDYHLPGGLREAEIIPLDPFREQRRPRR